MPYMLRAMLLGIVPVFAWASITSAETIPALIEALQDVNVRYGASLELTKRGAKAVPALRKSLITGNEDLRVWSAYTLGRMGPAAEPAVGDLKTALASSDDALRAAAAQALGNIGPSSSAAADSLSVALKDENVRVRNCAAVALGQIGPSAKNATSALIAALRDSQTRQSARGALMQIGRPAVNPLVKALDSDDLRFDVSQVLLAIDPKEAQQAGLDKATSADLPALRLVLFNMDRESAERTMAALALVSLGKDGVSVLVKALKEKRIARTAANAFVEAGPAAVPALIDVLSHKNPEVRATVVDALGSISPATNEAAVQLVEMLKDQDRNVRYRAVRALHKFGAQAKPAVPTLSEVILNSRESEQTRQWAIKTLLVTLPDTHDAVVKALIAATKDKNYGVSQLARQQVRQIDLKAAEKAGVK